MIFADAATPNANTVWLVILVLAGLGGNIATIVAVIQGSRKQKREVSFEFVPASKEEFDLQKKHCTDRHAQLFAEIKTLKENTGDEVESKIEVVRKDVVAVGKEVASLQTETRLQNQTLSSLGAKLDRLIERKMIAEQKELFAKPF
jgi:hypothetical protein